MYSFTGGSDGGSPWGGVILSSNTLYGATYAGGSSAFGAVFAVNTNGMGFRLLHTFTALGIPSNANYDGAAPNAGLVLSGSTLWGTAVGGGSFSYGIVFAVDTDGTGFTTLHDFSGGSDGALPAGGLILSGNILYGTALNGGTPGSGTVFNLALPPPQLTIAPAGTNVILTWPTNTLGFPAGFALQSATNLVSPAGWSTVSPSPSVVNGQYAVTNPIPGTQKFYRLSQ